MTSEQLEQQAERSRADVSKTLGELGERLTPGQLVDEVLAYTRDGGGQFLHNFGRQITDNPLPVTLIGAGLAWFLFSHNNENRSSTYRTSTREGMGSTTTDGTNLFNEAGDAIDSAARGIKDAAKSTASGLSDTAKTVGDKASSAYHSVSSGIDRAAHTVSQSAKDLEHRAAVKTHDVMEFMKEQPLVLAGVGIALGAAIGAALPPTKVEDELMGEASDQIKEQAKTIANENLDKAKKAGEHVYEEAKKEAKNQANSLADTTNDDMTEQRGGSRNRDVSMPWKTGNDFSDQGRL